MVYSAGVLGSDSVQLESDHRDDSEGDIDDPESYFPSRTGELGMHYNLGDIPEPRQIYNM